MKATAPDVSLRGAPARDAASMTVGSVLAFVVVSVVVQTQGTAGMWILGTYLVVLAAIPLLRRLRARRARSRRRGAVAAGEPPWERDWNASRTHASRPFLSRPVPWVVGFAVGTAALTGLVATLRDGIGARGPAWLALGVGALGVFLSWVVFRGGAQVRFDRFPYPVGERARFFVATNPGGPPLRDARFVLRCVATTTPRLAGYAPKQPWVVWSAERAAAADRWPGPDEFVEVEFDVPEDLAGTALHAEPPARWELVVTGRTRWGRMSETFVVPVYAARGAAA